MRSSLLVVLIAMLLGCSTVAEHARFELAEDTSSTIQVLFSEKVSKEWSGGFPPNLISLEEKAKACGATTRLFGNKDVERFFLQIAFSAKNRDELEIGLQCASTNDARFPQIDIETDDGLVSKSVHLHFKINLPFMIFGGEPPKEISFTLPGKINVIKDLSVMPAYGVVQNLVGANKFTLRIVQPTPQEAEKLFIKLCPKKKNCDHATMERGFQGLLEFDLGASRSKIDLPSILSLLGILLGSGVAFEITKHFMKKRRRPRPMRRRN